MHAPADTELGPAAARVAAAVAFRDGRAEIDAAELTRLARELSHLPAGSRVEVADELLALAARARRLGGQQSTLLVGQLGALALIVEAGPDAVGDAVTSTEKAAIHRLLGTDAPARAAARKASDGIDILRLRSAQS